MDDHIVEVPLPRSVEELLKKICFEQKLETAADATAREKLAVAGEEKALQTLRDISLSKIRNLSAYIIHMLKKSPSPSSSPSHSSPPKKPRLYAESHSPFQRLSSSPNTKTVRLFANPRAGLFPCSLNFETLTPPPRERGHDELEALGELEFKKQFLILNYIGRNDLGTVTTADEIRKLNHLPMVNFEAEVWRLFGQKYVNKEDRRMYHDWDSERTYLYDCYVSPEGSFRFKGPFLSNTRTHLQKVLGDDNILRVKFAEEVDGVSGIDSRDQNYAGYRKIAREGILVGLRRYCFFVFKDGGKEEKRKNPTSSPVKCYFIRINSDARVDKNASYVLSHKTISEARKLFMHAHTVSSVANYMARFSLILSKTYSLDIDLSTVTMNIIEDEYCVDEHGNCIYRDGKRLIHTDGTGFISEDLALKCPKNLHEGRCIKDEAIEIILNRDEHEDNVMEAKEQGIENKEPPMLMQCRLFNKGRAVKGTFLLNKTLPPKTIKVRDSMVKVELDPDLLNNPTANSLEIIGTSNRPKKAYFSRNLIALLSYGGVPNEFFLGLLRKALREAHGAFRNKLAAIRVAKNCGNMDKDLTIERMICAGIPIEEPYLQHRLSILLKEQKLSLRMGKLCADDSYYLMGTADPTPTGKLKSDEVCIVLDNGQVSGEVLVYRNPGVHFGDIHVLKATYVEELVSIVGNTKYAIFFSRKGPRSVADEIGGGDFDGDMYWVSRNPELLKHFKQSEPWSPIPSTRKVDSKRPDQFSDEELEDELFKLFLTTRFEPSFAMGEAADSWSALMDRFLILGDDCMEEKNLVKDKIIKLVDLYYDAVDAPKKGAKVEVPKELKSKSFPHYMEKKNSYNSVSILGKIYDEAMEYQAEDHSSKEIWKLPSFEVEVPQECFIKWSKYYEDYRKEMSNAMNINHRDVRNNATDQIKRKYKMLLYNAEELEYSKRSSEDIYNEALAIYHLCYNYAENKSNASYCCFAWNVAGSALYKLLTSKQTHERPVICLPSVLRELF